MTSVGERLRRERIRQGVDLAQLAKDTRINLKYLEAIEQGDPSQIPGGFFYRSFVRQYALALGLNPTDLESELERVKEAEAPLLNAALEAASLSGKRTRSYRGRHQSQDCEWSHMGLCFDVGRRCRRLFRVLFLGGAGWKHREVTTAQAVQTAPATPARTNSSPVHLDTVAQTNPASAPSAETPAPSPDDRVVLAVAAREKTWVTIRADGKTIFSGMLEPSETKVLGSKAKTFIKVGNAGGIEITWNGKPVPPLGERGQVKSVLFTPENFQIQPAAGGSL